MKIELEVIDIDKPNDLNVIIGQTHFIKSAEDIHETLISSVPGIKFGLAFSEASGKCLLRVEGNDETLKEIAVNNSLRIGCGHMFFLALGNVYPINVLNQIKNIPEVCRIFCATANPLQAIIGKTSQGKALLGVVDGYSPAGVENKEDVEWRRNLLRQIGYKF